MHLGNAHLSNLQDTGNLDQRFSVYQSNCPGHPTVDNETIIYKIFKMKKSLFYYNHADCSFKTIISFMQLDTWPFRIQFLFSSNLANRNNHMTNFWSMERKLNVCVPFRKKSVKVRSIPVPSLSSFLLVGMWM